MKGTALRAVLLATLLAGFLGWLHAVGVGLKLLLIIGLVFSVVILVLGLQMLYQGIWGKI